MTVADARSQAQQRVDRGIPCYILKRGREYAWCAVADYEADAWKAAGWIKYGLRVPVCQDASLPAR